MSYILDSLKRSDEERRIKNSAVSLDKPVWVAGNQHTSKMPWFVGGLIVVLLVLMFFVLDSGGGTVDQKRTLAPMTLSLADPEVTVTKKESLASDDASADELVKPLAIKREEKVQPAVKNEKKLLGARSEIERLYERKVRPEAIKKHQESVVHTNKPASLVDKLGDVTAIKASAPSTTISAIPTIYEVDRLIQQSIPAIEYGAHIYATDKTSGFVILNGVKRQAGEKMGNGVYIEQVNENAVVLSFQGVVFSLPAMKSWTP